LGFVLTAEPSRIDEGLLIIDDFFVSFVPFVVGNISVHQRLSAVAYA